jgi:hypothetical protein
VGFYYTFFSDFLLLIDDEVIICGKEATEVVLGDLVEDGLMEVSVLRDPDTLN